MTAEAKKDNAYLAHKLALRRYFLDKYHKNPPHVFDCCQGSQVIWTQLKSEYELKSYFGVDLKPRKGRLTIDSVRILDQPGWNFDVIDCDTYGSPFKHWNALLGQLQKPTTVFLTIGQGMSNFVLTGYLEVRAIFGSTVSRRGTNWVTANGNPISPRFLSTALSVATDVLIRRHGHPVAITECVEALAKGGTARYIGVRIEPQPTSSA